MNEFIKNYIDTNLYYTSKLTVSMTDNSIWIQIYYEPPFHIEFNLYKYDEGILCFRIENENYDSTGHPYECEYTYNINTNELEENTSDEFNLMYNQLRKYIDNNKDFIKIILMLREKKKH